ncbi:MAG TPA: glycoside hydrolase family 2 TIM barrel-domain containing protein [Verrucomicrobiae bacterium]|nr:glycoside hydrolase family 2 TIM barrel-domain containing protein [Verrucomicrobiae bacterium]
MSNNEHETSDRTSRLHALKKNLNFRQSCIITRSFCLALSCAAVFGLTARGQSENHGPTKAEIRKTDSGYQLYVDGKPFWIKGAGLGSGTMEQLAVRGGNSVRTWGSGGGEALLARAQKNGLCVTLGLDVGRERNGFNYDDPVMVARQLERIKTQVLRYKDQPALIIWAIGNELNLNAENPKVWDAVNGISKMIHEVDPNHLTTTPLAGVNLHLLHELKTRAPDLDLLAVQMYADIVNLPRYLHEAQWDGPYIVTEWGATGHWESPKTDWGAPFENDSTVKAGLYEKRYDAVIATDPQHCLGSYAFLWGQKQERTPTWYGVFLDSGEQTESVDVLQHLWSGNWPTNRSPQIKGAWLNGETPRQSVHLKPGTSYTAKILAKDPDNDALAYSWEILKESSATSVGGDFEAKPSGLAGLISNRAISDVTLSAPAQPGAYRLFAYVRDGHGHAAHMNIPFYVDATNAVEVKSAAAGTGQ